MLRKFVSDEKKYHDAVAKKYYIEYKNNYLWQIPEEIFLIKPEFFLEKKVIDMGCGPSTSIINIVKKEILNKCNYYGIDISKEMLKIAQRNIPSGIFICADMSTINFKNNSIDTIVSLGALHHVEDKIKTLKHWIYLLNKNGYLLLREPLYDALKRGSGASPGEEGIKSEEIMNFLICNNCKIVKCVYFSSPLIHLFNRILIKFNLNEKSELKWLWYIVTYIDGFLSTRIRNNISFFKAKACAITVKKL